MRLHENNRRMLVLILLTVVSNGFITMRTSGQIYTPSDFYVYIRVNLDENALAFYNVNITMGSKSINTLSEAGWVFKIQLPKWATSNLIFSTEMPRVFPMNGEAIPLTIEEDVEYDYLVAKIPMVQDEFNATVKIGFVQRDYIYQGSIGFKLPILTGFNIIPEYVNFTLLTNGKLSSYSQYLQYFTPIFSNDIAIGLWSQYFRTSTVGNITITMTPLKSFDRCVIESLDREVTVSEKLYVSVRDVLKIRYIGTNSTWEILKINLPSPANQTVTVRDALGLLSTSRRTLTDTNSSLIMVYARYSLDNGQSYEAVVDYSIPIKNVLKTVQGELVTIRLKGVANYTDIVDKYSLRVKVEGRNDWNIMGESNTASLKSGETYSHTVSNVMPDLLVQSFEVGFTQAQLEAGKSPSIILGLSTVLVLAVVGLFREKTVKPALEAKEKKETEKLVERIVEALREKINYECLSEEAKVKNTLGKLPSKEYKASMEGYSRMISSAEKRILNAIGQISLKNPKAGEDVKKYFGVFEELNNDSKKMIDNTIERFRGGRITRSVFENLTGKYLKENRKRRETAASDVYSALERLLS